MGNRRAQGVSEGDSGEKILGPEMMQEVTEKEG